MSQGRNQVSESQAVAVNLCISGANVFITGPPGAGKTFTVERAYEELSRRGKRIAITSSTSSSANLYTITQARTLHSFMGMGIGLETSQQLYERLKRKQYVWRKLIELETLFVDEVTMMDSEYFRKMSEVLQMVRMNRCPFGGIQMICIGDPTQLNFGDEGAVQIRSGQNFRHRGSPTTIFDTQTWRTSNFQIVYLEENHRAKDDPRFFQALTNITMGEFNDEDWEYISQARNNTLTNPTQVVCTHAEAERINLAEIARYNISVKHFPAINYAKLGKSTPATEYVLLGEGIPVVMVGTHYVRSGVPSGVFGRVLEVHHSNKMHECWALVQFENGITLRIEYRSWDVANEKVWAMPIILRYALTVNRVQGLTVPGPLSVDLRHAFNAHQGLTAISRVTKLENLHFVGIKENFVIDTHTMQLNRAMRQIHRERMSRIRQGQTAQATTAYVPSMLPVKKSEESSESEESEESKESEESEESEKSESESKESEESESE